MRCDPAMVSSSLETLGLGWHTRDRAPSLHDVLAAPPAGSVLRHRSELSGRPPLLDTCFCFLGAAGRESRGGPASLPRPELLERLCQGQAGVSRARGRAARRAGARGRGGGGVGGARARVAAATGPWAAGA